MSEYYHNHSPEEENGPLPPSSVSLEYEKDQTRSPSSETAFDFDSLDGPSASTYHGHSDDKPSSVPHLEFDDNKSWQLKPSLAPSVISEISNTLTYAPSVGLPSPPPSPPLSRATSSPQSQSQPQSQDNWKEDRSYTGRRRALCIGIDYYDEQAQRSELESCVRDAKRMRHLLIKHFRYRTEDVTLLTDDPQHDVPNVPNVKPTRDNILSAMSRLVHDARPGDSFFFHYSGHGDQTIDTDGDEDDGQDEIIYPVDYDRSNFIVDDELHNIMVKPLPPGCRFTAVYDSCHSGSLLDLPYRYAHDPQSGVLEAKNEHAILEKSSEADVVCWSACKDSEIALGSKKTGAMSSAFLSVFKEERSHSYESLLTAINVKVHKNKYFTQKPQLSTSHPINLAHPYMM